MKKRRPPKGSDLEGNAWGFPSLEAARGVYQAALKQPALMTGAHDASLDTGLFAHHPVLVFLWGPSVDPEVVRSVELLATLGGGRELVKEMKAEVLRQVRLRWRALRSRRPLGGTLMRHHPHGQVWTDLRD